MSQANMSGPLLRNITLIVEDIERAKAFYIGTLGFKTLKDYGDYVSMQTPGGILIGLHAPHDGHTHVVETRGVEFSFLVTMLTVGTNASLARAFLSARSPKTRRGGPERRT